jgi:DNA polymerase
MSENLLIKIENYLDFYREQFGTTLYMDDVRIAEILGVDELLLETESVSFLDGKIINEIKPPKKKSTNSTVDNNWDESGSLPELYDKIHNCKECKLGLTRNKFVFGVGNPNADIMIIGEAPGADEDEQGEPFVGKAGQLLTQILKAINLTREEVFIANIVKCRPPNNRPPAVDEVDECEPYLHKQIDIIKPKFILALGLTAINTLFKKTYKMSEIRGQILNYRNIKLMVTYHPAALLRNPNWKKPAWEDVQLLRKLYDEYLEGKK